MYKLPQNIITKTCLYIIDPLKPHFYIVNWRLQGYTLFFLFLIKNIDCGYSLQPPRRKYRSFFLSGNFQFFGGEDMVSQDKICSFKIKSQTKNDFASDVERTVVNFGPCL